MLTTKRTADAANRPQTDHLLPARPVLPSSQPRPCQAAVMPTPTTHPAPPAPMPPSHAQAAPRPRTTTLQTRPTWQARATLQPRPPLQAGVNKLCKSGVTLRPSVVAASSTHQLHQLQQHPMWRPARARAAQGQCPWVCTTAGSCHVESHTRHAEAVPGLGARPNRRAGHGTQLSQAAVRPAAESGRQAHARRLRARMHASVRAWRQIKRPCRPRLGYRSRACKHRWRLQAVVRTHTLESSSSGLRVRRWGAHSSMLSMVQCVRRPRGHMRRVLEVSGVHGLMTARMSNRWSRRMSQSGIGPLS